MGGALVFRHKQRSNNFISFTIKKRGDEEEPLVKDLLAPKRLQLRHISACFVTVEDSLVAIGGYNTGDKRM